MSIRSSKLAVAFAMAGAAAASAQQAPIYSAGSLKPHQLLAREIYKELIEINTGVTTGNVTPAAVAMAQRFKAAGVPDSDIFVGGRGIRRHGGEVARVRLRRGAAVRLPGYGPLTGS